MMNKQYLLDQIVDIEGYLANLKATYKLGQTQGVIINEDTASLSNILSNIFPNKKITVQIYSNPKVRNYSIMSVFPSESTMEKMVLAIIEQKGTLSTINKILQGEKEWIVEIDEMALSPKLNLDEKELAALLLHEIGHIIYSNYIGSKISSIIQLKVLQWSRIDRKIIGDIWLRKFLFIPLAGILFKDRKLSNIKDEIKADKFSQDLGYGPYLSMAIKKVSIYFTSQVKPVYKTDDEEISDSVDYTQRLIECLKKRENTILDRELRMMYVQAPSIVIQNLIQSLITTLRGKRDNNSSMQEHVVIKNIDDCVEKYIKECKEEEIFEFQLFVKKMKKIDPADIDYIGLQVNDIKSNDDKMMIVSYIYNKLDIIDYYIKLIEYDNPKYIIPHSKESLMNMRNLLLKYKDVAINKKINDNIYTININGFPQGYEG